MLPEERGKVSNFGGGGGEASFSLWGQARRKGLWEQQDLREGAFNFNNIPPLILPHDVHYITVRNHFVQYCVLLTLHMCI